MEAVNIQCRGPVFEGMSGNPKRNRKVIPGGSIAPRIPLSYPENALLRYNVPGDPHKAAPQLPQSISRVTFLLRF